MTFKMKGPSLYKKLKVNRNGYSGTPDGRPTSSPFQDGDHTKEGGYYKDSKHFMKHNKEEMDKEDNEKSFFEKSTEEREKGAPVETDDNKKGNVEKYKEKNQQYVYKDVPLDPGFEDTEKIQKVQSEGITPHSQKFGKFKALKEVKVDDERMKEENKRQEELGENVDEVD